MKRLVERHRFGFVTRDETPAALAEVLDRLQPDSVRSARRNASEAGRTLCWDAEREKLINLVAGIQRT
jgi:hypothetical protein